MKLQIGVIGYAGSEEYPRDKSIPENIFSLAEEVGFLIAKNGAVVVTGGKGGVMESAARGAKKAGGITIGVVGGSKRFTSNSFTDVEVISGASTQGLDEFLLVNMCDALIVLGGGAGTLEEIAIAYRNQKPIVALKNTSGWAEKLGEQYLDERETRKIELAETPEEAVSKAISSVKHHTPSF